MSADNHAQVDVTFIDGEVKTYTISAGPKIGGHLARQASETGILVLFNDEVSHGIPMVQVREYLIRKAPLENTDNG